MNNKSRLIKLCPIPKYPRDETGTKEGRRLKEKSISQNCKNTQEVAADFKRINVTQFLTITPRHPE